MTVRFCGNCNQNVEPKKSFSVGKFVGLFILGLILAFPFGAIITSMESQFGYMAAQQQDAELGRQLMVDMATYIGSFLFILSWRLYIIHYWTKAKKCPICGDENWTVHHVSNSTLPQTVSITSDGLDETHTPKKRVSTKWFKTTNVIILSVIAIMAIQAALPFPYGFVASVPMFVILVTALYRNSEFNERIRNESYYVKLNSSFL